MGRHDSAVRSPSLRPHTHMPGGATLLTLTEHTRRQGLLEMTPVGWLLTHFVGVSYSLAVSYILLPPAFLFLFALCVPMPASISKARTQPEFPTVGIVGALSFRALSLRRRLRTATTFLVRQVVIMIMDRIIFFRVGSVVYAHLVVDRCASLPDASTSLRLDARPSSFVPPRPPCGCVPGCQFKLYWLILGMATLCFAVSWLDIHFALSQRWGHKKRLNKCNDEMEWWVTLFTVTLWVVLHRFRSTVKALNRAKDAAKNK